MAIQILPQSGGAAGAGESTANAISEGLHALTQAKMKQMQHKQSVSDLRGAFPELPEEALSFLAKQPAKEQQQYLQQFAQGQQQQRPAQQLSGLQNLAQQGPQQPELQGSQGAFSPAAVSPEQKQELREYLETPEAQQSYKPEEIEVLKNFASAPEQQQTPSMPQQPMQAPVQEKPSLLKAMGSSAGISVSDKQQAQIDKNNKPFLKTMNEYIANASKRKELAQEALDIVKRGNVTSGLVGLIPESILTSLSPDNAQFVTKISDLANTKALELRGPVGKAKLEAAARTKASLNQPTEAQISILESEIKDAQKAEDYEKAYEELVAENNGAEPANIEAKIRKRVKEFGDSSSEGSGSNEFDSLPKASEYAGKRIAASNGEILKSDGKRWVKESK